MLIREPPGDPQQGANRAAGISQRAAERPDNNIDDGSAQAAWRDRLRDERRAQDRNDALVIIGEVAAALRDHSFIVDDSEIAALSGDLHEALRLLDQAGEP
jgi:hypothetical protein